MLLSIENLHTQFSSEEGTVRAVGGVSFSLDKGEILGVVGESGSGKSVMSMSILGLIPDPPGRITQGTIVWDEGNGPMDLVKATEKQKRAIRGDRIAMIFQDPMTSLNPYLTILEQLAEVLETHRGMSRKEATPHVISMLEDVGIPAASSRIFDYPHQLSGGMRQRVMIAMALLCDPALLIADEPTTALDVTVQAQILDLLRHEKRASPRQDGSPEGGAEGSKKREMAILLITHDLGVVAQMADRVAVMYAGKFVEVATATDLFAKPHHPYTIGLLQSVPRVTDEMGAALVPIAGMPPSLSAVPSGCAFHPRCPHAMAICSKEEPQERVVSEASEYAGGRRKLHLVVCHLDDAPEVVARDRRGGEEVPV